MKTKKNFKDFDYQTIVVKKDKADEILKRYECLQWKVVEAREHAQYEDLIEVEIQREHNLKNKDELQLLQIYIENDLNQIAKAERNKHSKTTALGLLFGVFLVCFLASGVTLLCLMQNLTTFIVSPILLGFALGLIVLEAVLLPKIFKKEKIVFSEKLEKYNTQLDLACQNAMALSGDDYGNNKEEK